MGILLPEALDARLDIAVAGAEAYDYPLRGVALVDQNEVASEENTSESHAALGASPRPGPLGNADGAARAGSRLADEALPTAAEADAPIHGTFNNGEDSTLPRNLIQVRQRYERQRTPRAGEVGDDAAR